MIAGNAETRKCNILFMAFSLEQWTFSLMDWMRAADETKKCFYT